MTVILYSIPDDKIPEVTRFIAKAGGTKVTLKKLYVEEDRDDEVTHEHFFGENIKRLIKAFKK